MDEPHNRILFDPNAEDVAAFGSLLDIHLNQGSRRLARELRPFVLSRGWEHIFRPDDKYPFESCCSAIGSWRSSALRQDLRSAQLRDGAFRYWVYSAKLCWSHRHLDGISLSPEHIFWLTFFPANGWHCCCSVYGCRTVAGIVRLGGDPAKLLPENWAPVDPITGLPAGIERDFGTRFHPDLRAGLLALSEGRHEDRCDLPPEPAIDH